MNDWVLATSAAAISLLIGVSTYFIQKWIEAVDTHIKENSDEIAEVKREVTTIKTEQKIQTKGLTETIRTELRAIDTKSFPIEKIEEALREVRSYVEKPPQVPDEILGKLIIIQQRQSAADKKVETLYKTVKIVVDRLSVK